MLDSNSRTRERIEAAIAKHIRSQPASINRLFRNDIRYRPRKTSEQPFPVTISCEDNVLGMPECMEA